MGNGGINIFRKLDDLEQLLPIDNINELYFFNFNSIKKEYCVMAENKTIAFEMLLNGLLENEDDEYYIWKDIDIENQDTFPNGYFISIGL